MASTTPTTTVGAPENANAECVGPASENAGKASSCAGCPNQSACASGKGRETDPAVAEVAERMSDIKHKILVLSGKGGVGKSTVSSQLAWALRDQGFSVGILDIDICGPTVPQMMGVELQEVRRSSLGWSPVYAAEGLGVMSVGFMLGSRDDAIIWRGPKKTGLIKQFLTDVYWGELDFLIIDSPPGTSDEHITVSQMLKGDLIDGAVVVTTPQEVSLCAVRKELNFCKKVGFNVLGVVENMSAFVCPCCQVSSPLFPASVGGGPVKMAADMNVPYLGPVPHDPALLAACETGRSYLDTCPRGSAAAPLRAVIRRILTSTPSLTATFDAHRKEHGDEWWTRHDTPAAPSTDGKTSHHHGHATPVPTPSIATTIPAVPIVSSSTTSSTGVTSMDTTTDNEATKKSQTDSSAAVTTPTPTTA